MKKFVLLLICLLLVLSVGCTKETDAFRNVSCEDIMNAAVNATTHPESDKIYTYEKANLDSYSMSLWSDGLFQESSELEKLSDYAIFISAGTTMYEVAVLRTEKKEDVSVLTDLIERRKETLALGDKGMYDPDFKKRMNSSKLITEGNTVIFIVTDDNSAAETAINSLK